MLPTARTAPRVQSTFPESANRARDRVLKQRMLSTLTAFAAHQVETRQRSRGEDEEAHSRLDEPAVHADAEEPDCQHADAQRRRLLLRFRTGGRSGSRGSPRPYSAASTRRKASSLIDSAAPGAQAGAAGRRQCRPQDGLRVQDAVTLKAPGGDQILEQDRHPGWCRWATPGGSPRKMRIGRVRKEPPPATTIQGRRQRSRRARGRGRRSLARSPPRRLARQRAAADPGRDSGKPRKRYGAVGLTVLEALRNAGRETWPRRSGRIATRVASRVRPSAPQLRRARLPPGPGRGRPGPRRHRR